MAYRVCITGALERPVSHHLGRHHPVRALDEPFGPAGLGGLDDQAAVGEN